MFSSTTASATPPSFPPSVPIPTTSAAGAVGPNSPPQTPNLSPQSTRQTSPKSRYSYANPSPSSSGGGDFSRPSFVTDIQFEPVGSGHHFSYRPSPNLPELSPRSSSPYPPAPSVEIRDIDDDIYITGIGAGAEDLASIGSPILNDDEAEDADDESCSGSRTRSPSDDDDSLDLEAEFKSHFLVATTWIVEELSDVDPMEDETERLHLLRPYIIEDPESTNSESLARSRYHQHHHPRQELDKKMMRTLRKLDFSSSSSSTSSDSDDFESQDLAHQDFIRKQRELRMRKRRSHSMASIGSKRTLSELSGDSDDLEDQGPLDFNSAGSSARRMRRRTDRWSIQFADPPPPRIDEQEEPAEEGRIRVGRGGDNTWDRANLMQELPYCTMEIMEVDSS